MQTQQRSGNQTLRQAITQYSNYRFTLITMKGCHYCEEFKQITWDKIKDLANTESYSDTDPKYKETYFEGFPTVLIYNDEDVQIGLLDGFMTPRSFCEQIQNIVGSYEREKSTPGIPFEV